MVVLENMLIEEMHRQLGWPEPRQIWSPDGAGPSVIARWAREKIGSVVRRLPEGSQAKVGILSENPLSNATEQPLAIVCDFQRQVSLQTLTEVHKLAWNFCRSPLLITVEPDQVRAWTCWEEPSGDLGGAKPVAEITFDPKSQSFFPSSVADMFRWISLASGEFFKANQERFRPEQRADQMLLSNLASVKGELTTMGLPDDTVHDLLARLIFVQFLRQRTDSTGIPALHTSILEQLHVRGVLSRPCSDLSAILENKEDTYNLFRWLNDRFNGDLFPGKGATPEDREAEWRAEMEIVNDRHLHKLAEFVRGDLEVENGQRCLWPLYSFDAIPLEFISSIYEEFVSKSSDAVGAHYTPGHVVDFILDKVLPWEGERWRLRILDPACGSGIFLVKSFQRLVHRWRKLNADSEPLSGTLREILQDQLFGVDINPHAVRVASFSLYLAMCDEIDPKKYWTDVIFPRLRNVSIIHADFFREDVSLFSTKNVSDRFDIIVGNAPWGQKSLTSEALEWASNNDWPVANKQIGTLFLAKASTLIESGGKISMLQPAGALLFNRSSTANSFRRKLFEGHKVEEIVDLSALRLILFPHSASPACLVTLCAQPPGDSRILYSHPHESNSIEAEGRLVIEPYNVHSISPHEAAADPWIWTALAWGGRRDLNLLHRLTYLAESGMMVTLNDLKQRTGWKGREGFKRGDRSKRKDYLADGRYVVVTAEDIRPFQINPNLDVNRDPFFHSRDSSDDDVFNGPLLLISKSWRVDDGFRAAIYSGDVVFPGSTLYGLRFPPEDRWLAEAACLVINSSFSEWFLGLTSGRAASYRPEVLAGELLKMPIGNFSEIRRAMSGKTMEQVVASEQAEDFARKLLGFNEVEWSIIDDFARIALRDFRQPTKSAGGEQPTSEDLRLYCSYFVKVMQAGFGNHSISATIFRSADNSFPVRVIGFHLDYPSNPQVLEVEIDEKNLLEMVEASARRALRGEYGDGVAYQKVARIYEEYRAVLRGRELTPPIPSVFFLKPNEFRYWSRTAALRDADHVAADIMESKGGARRTGSQEYLM